MTAHRKTVLITGAGGFIGSNLVDDQLKRGNTVRAFDVNLDRLRHLAGSSSVELITGDMRDAAMLGRITKGVDIIHHLASAHLEVSRPESYYWETNVTAAVTLAKKAHENGVSRFVHCSSVGVFGPLATLPANEDTPCHPEILYERTKLAGEEEIRAFHRESGLPTIILRPAWVYGPRCPRTLKLLKTIKKGKFLLVGPCNNFRHPIYIDDMSAAFHLAGESSHGIGETFIIAGDQAVPLKDLINAIARTLQVTPPSIRVPFPVMGSLCWLVETIFGILGKEPPFSRRSLKFFSESSQFDITRAKTTLAFTPLTDLATGLKTTCDWFTANGQL